MARKLQLWVLLLCMVVATTCTGMQERPIRFVTLAFGASDATGVGAVPLSDGYVYLIQMEVERHMPGVFLMNLGVPGAGITVVTEQARLAQQSGMRADLVTLWTGANDLINGDEPQQFQQCLRALVKLLRTDLSDLVVVANLPDLTQLPRFRARPSTSVTPERIARFNQVIAEEASGAGALLVDLFANPVRDELVFDGDGFHPNNAGHREIAAQFLRVLLPRLARG